MWCKHSVVGVVEDESALVEQQPKINGGVVELSVVVGGI